MSFSRRILIVGLALLGLACVIRAPVSLITLILPQHVQLKNVTGTLWTGNASAIGVSHSIVQERVDWQFCPQSLLSGRIEWIVSGRFGERTSKLIIGLTHAGVVLGDASVFLPLEPFAALHPKLKALRIGAILHVSTHHMRPHSPTSAKIEVDGLFSPLIASSGQLGRFQLALDIDEKGLGHWDISPLPGILSVSGQGKFNINDPLQFNGQLALNLLSPLPSLSSLLSQLPKTDTGYLISF